MAFIITKNSINFTTPVKECPTRDNVRVDVDIDINFRILDDEKNIKNFVYKLGAVRLGDILKMEIEEAIRNFLRGVKYEDALGLKSEMAKMMVEELNGKFKNYGVVVEYAIVASIKLPDVFG